MDDLEGLNLDPLDFKAVAPVLRGHVALVESLHRQHGRLYGLGGVLVMSMSALLPMMVHQRVVIGAFQVALIAGLSLLSGLVVVRMAAVSQAERLRRRAHRYCEAEDVDLEALRAVVARVSPRWFFFTAIWSGVEP